tara:strand:- start:17553 stop:18035 length:483 start_codon:yes stop_codon:yes gene_type:complete
MCLTILTKVGVMADSTLVANTLNIRQVLLVFAKRTVAVDAVMTVDCAEWLGQRLINGHKSVARMDVLRTLDTVGAVVPVWAVQALVTDTVYELVTTIADSRVAHVPSSIAEKVGQSGQSGVGCGCLESVARVVAVLVANVAVHAQVVIVAGQAGDELILR